LHARFDSTPYTTAALDAFAADLEGSQPEEWDRLLSTAQLQADALAA
jgi:hypothetical protein